MFDSAVGELWVTWNLMSYLEQQWLWEENASFWSVWAMALSRRLKNEETITMGFWEIMFQTRAEETQRGQWEIPGDKPMDAHPTWGRNMAGGLRGAGQPSRPMTCAVFAAAYLKHLAFKQGIPSFYYAPDPEDYVNLLVRAAGLVEHMDCGLCLGLAGKPWLQMFPTWTWLLKLTHPWESWASQPELRERTWPICNQSIAKGSCKMY